MTITEPAVVQWHEVIDSLHSSWMPHQGQINVGRALFNDDKRKLFIACGRKWGKTELIVYFLWRWAMTHPNKGCWYIAPEMKQARKLVWTDPRLMNFGPTHWISKVNNSEMRIELKNGSFIQVDGSDNYNAHRGTRPGIVVYEESKDHRPQFRSSMRPNMAVYDAPEIHIGTPPNDDDKDECQKYWDDLVAEYLNDPSCFHYTAPSRENPYIDRKWLETERARLYGLGKGHEWEQEYEAKRVKGGSRVLFPMLPFKEQALTPHDQLMKRLHKDRKKLQWYWFADPAAASCFGVLFCAINPYSKDVFWLDEIYETEQQQMTVRMIGAEIIRRRNELWDAGDWREGYDEAETWFRSEWENNFPEESGLEPSHKAKNDKDDGITLIKDIMLGGKWFMSDRCQKFHWELSKYKTDANGRLIKKDDHLIDCIAGDELITTARGLVPIAEVIVGDEVMTRSGWRKVIDSWLVGCRATITVEFSDGRKLVCTPEHRVFTENRGFVRADSLSYVDRVVTDEQCHQSMSYSMGSPIDAIQAPNNQACAFTIGVQPRFSAKPAFAICTTLFGLPRTVQFLRGITFIIETATRSITKLKTLNAFTPALIGWPIVMTAASEDNSKANSLYLKELGRFQSLGMGQKRAKDGTPIMARTSLPIARLRRASAINAGAITKLMSLAQTATLGFARAIAKQYFAAFPGLIMRRGNAQFAASPLQSTGTQGTRLAQGRAVTVLGTRPNKDMVRVYDLTIEGAPEFFASGVLVHNCARYILGADHYQLRDELEPVKEEDDDGFRGARIEDDFKSEFDLDEYGREYE